MVGVFGSGTRRANRIVRGRRLVASFVVTARTGGDKNKESGAEGQRHNSVGV